MLSIVNLGQAEPVLKMIAVATQSLLRDTIDLDEAQWREPSLLPGWTRAHVVSHVARNADALRRLIAATLSGDPAPLYPSELDKINDIERGAERTGLELHVDLDTSAGEFARLCDRVEDWMTPVRLPGGEYPLSVVALIRLQEVLLHHLDLNTGFGPADVDSVPARWLLQWTALLMREDLSLPAVDLVSDSGEKASIGGAGARRKVIGPDAALWAWVTGRRRGGGLIGAEGITFPLAG